MMKRMRALSYLVTGNPAHKPGGSLDDETPGVSGSQARKGKNRRPSTLPISVQSHLERDSSSSSSEDDAYGGLGKGMPSLKEGGSDSEEENGSDFDPADSVHPRSPNSFGWNEDSEDLPSEGDLTPTSVKGSQKYKARDRSVSMDFDGFFQTLYF